jgi:CRISPR-associated protein, Csd1 family
MARTAYQLGRLLAALEHIKATNQPRQLYVQASSQPSALVPVLARATTSPSAVDILTPIVGQLPDDAFSRELTNEESSDFALGYYHQRADFRKGVLPALPETEPDLDARYEFRIDADLKSWVKTNGGDKLIRALLREARDKR